MSKNFSVWFCIVLLNLNDSFLNITFLKTAKFRFFAVFCSIMETGACAKCIKNGKGTASCRPQNEKFLYVYPFYKRSPLVIPGFFVNHVYKTTRLHTVPHPEKTPKRRGFSAFFANAPHKRGTVASRKRTCVLIFA